MQGEIDAAELTAPPPTELEYTETGDTAEARSKSPRIKSLDQLLRAAHVDLKVWEVERHVINKWEVGRKDKQVHLTWPTPKEKKGFVRDTGKIFVEPLWQVKVWLRRREPQVRAGILLLDQLRKHAVPVPRIKRPKPRKTAPARSLEIGIMDPHIGLLCRWPEADGPWDLALAQGYILQAVDDLVAIARPFGPFTEVFLPLGNDWAHADGVWHTTTAGTPQPEMIDWQVVYQAAQEVALLVVERLRAVAPVKIYGIPGNHDRQTAFTLARLIAARYHAAPDVAVDDSSSPYKFHRCGVNLIGYEHGHSVKPIRLAALMANECRDIWGEVEYMEWHLGDQHRKGSSKPSMLEEQGVSVEYTPGLTAPNAWHRIKSFSHQQRGAMAWVWDHHLGPLGRFQWNISKYTHAPLKAHRK